MKNGLLKKFFEICGERIALGIQRVEFLKRFYFPKHMSEAFLFGKCLAGIIG